MVTSLLSLPQRYVEKTKKMMKIVNIDGENFQWIFSGVFRKNVTYDNIKSHKKQGFNLSLRDKYFKIKFDGTTCNSNQKLSKWV